MVSLQNTFFGGDFSSGPVVKNLPANTKDMGLIPGLGRSHMLWGNSSLCTTATESLPSPQATNYWRPSSKAPCSATKKSPHCPQLGKPGHGNKDPVQLWINKYVFKILSSWKEVNYFSTSMKIQSNQIRAFIARIRSLRSKQGVRVGVR